jgi:hypothetical protein
VNWHSHEVAPGRAVQSRKESTILWYFLFKQAEKRSANPVGPAKKQDPSKRWVFFLALVQLGSELDIRQMVDGTRPSLMPEYTRRIDYGITIPVRALKVWNEVSKPSDIWYI